MFLFSIAVVGSETDSIDNEWAPKDVFQSMFNLALPFPGSSMA